jgi:glycosyltransferase involved in cell wall biosynthesis
MRISVVIPTYNRAATLRKALEGYARQSGDHQLLEVLVVDDGSQDDTEAVVRQFSRESDLPVRHLKQENLGISAARNHALREARGELILFGDDDIIPSPGMVAEHVAWHNRYPEPEVGVLGHIAWARELHPTPFMEWSGLYGPQFNFGYFKRGMQLDFRYAYFCNTSVKLRFLERNGVFDERFRSYGYEDLELSYRLGKNGYRLLYNPDAAGFHYKYETFEDTLRRVRKLHEAWPTFSETEAGQELRKLLLSHDRQSKRWGALKRTLKPLKSCVMPLLRPLCNTHVPLPGWLYNQVFYHYVKPIFDDRFPAQEFPVRGTK